MGERERRSSGVDGDEYKTATYSRETRQEQGEKAKAMKAFALFKHT